MRWPYVMLWSFTTYGYFWHPMYPWALSCAVWLISAFYLKRDGFHGLLQFAEQAFGRPWPLMNASLVELSARKCRSVKTDCSHGLVQFACSPLKVQIISSLHLVALFAWFQGCGEGQFSQLGAFCGAVLWGAPATTPLSGRFQALVSRKHTNFAGKASFTLQTSMGTRTKEICYRTNSKVILSFKNKRHNLFGFMSLLRT
jgi:hypothetical protein